MVSSSHYSDHESEFSEILQKKRKFSDPIAAKRYEDTNILTSEQDSHKPPVKYKTFLACVVEHSKCNGQIITNNFVHHCFCPYHSFRVKKEVF